MTDARADEPELDFRAPRPWDAAAPMTAFQLVERGWRPALGWVCGLALAYNFIAAPATGREHVEEGKLWVVATVALGLAGVRTIERVGPAMARRPA